MGDGEPTLGGLAEVGANLVEGFALRVATGQRGNAGGIAAGLGCRASTSRRSSGGKSPRPTGPRAPRRWSMSFDLIVYLKRSAMPTPTAWQQAIRVCLVDRLRTTWRWTAGRIDLPYGF